MSNLLVAVKLNCKDSQSVLQYVVRSLVDGQDTIHVLCVILQHEYWEGQRLQAQTQIRQQYGRLLQDHKHKLHIVRVLTNGDNGDKPAVAVYVARAVCAKAALLHADVIVVGGKQRLAPSGAPRSSAVAESVGRHSRHPVLCISPEHPLLDEALPSIAEEPLLADSFLDSFPACAAGALQSDCRRASSLAHQTLSDKQMLPGSLNLQASCLPALSRVR